MGSIVTQPMFVFRGLLMPPVFHSHSLLPAYTRCSRSLPMFLSDGSQDDMWATFGGSSNTQLQNM